MDCHVCEDIRRIAKHAHESAFIGAAARADQLCRILPPTDYVREYLDCYGKQYTKFYYQIYDELYQHLYNAVIYNLIDYKDNPTCAMHASK